MADRTSVSNLALTKMGASDTITAPDQDSHAARTIAGVWDDVRQASIRGGKKAPRWNFAKRYAESAARSATLAKPIPFGWNYAFPMPANFLRLIEIVDPYESARNWDLVGTDSGREVLTCAQGPLKYWYLIDVPEVALWDAAFVQAQAALLAYETCERITGDSTLKQLLYKEWEDLVAGAAHVDAVENPPVEPEEDDWVMARYGWGGPFRSRYRR